MQALHCLSVSAPVVALQGLVHRRQSQPADFLIFLPETPHATPARRKPFSSTRLMPDPRPLSTSVFFVWWLVGEGKTLSRTGLAHDQRPTGERADPTAGLGIIVATETGRSRRLPAPQRIRKCPELTKGYPLPERGSWGKIY